MTNQIQDLQILSETLQSEINKLLRALNVAVNSEGAPRFAYCAPNCNCHRVKIVGFSNQNGFIAKHLLDKIKTVVSEANENESCLQMTLSDSEGIVILAALLRAKESQLQETQASLAIMRTHKLLNAVS